MKYLPLFVATFVSLLSSGCISTAPLTPARLSKLQLILLYEDKITVESNQGIILSSKKDVEIPGVGAAVNEELKSGFTKAGFTATPSNLTPAVFWENFVSTSKTKEGSSWHLGVTKNLQETLKNLRQEGLLPSSAADAIVIVGPLGVHYDATFMARDGTALSIMKGPTAKLAAGLTGIIQIFDATSLKPVGYGHPGVFKALEFDKKRFDFENLSDADRELLTDIFATMTRENSGKFMSSLKLFEGASTSAR